jgi:hypothetical protein
MFQTLGEIAVRLGLRSAATVSEHISNFGTQGLRTRIPDASVGVKYWHHPCPAGAPVASFLLPH